MYVTHMSPGCLGAQVMRRHGNATAYAFQLDGDYIVKNGWRLRMACIRLQKECRHRHAHILCSLPCLPGLVQLLHQT